MELSPQFLIDFSINLGGYLLAAILGGLLYRLVNRKPAPATAMVTENNHTAASMAMVNLEEKPVAAKNDTKMDFISFTKTAPEKTNNAVDEIDDLIVAPPKKNANRNRKEIIQLSSKMLNADFSNDRIKELLPVSDGELALISLSKK